MQALVVPDPSAQTMEQLQWQERPMPNLGPTEVLIKTQAVGLNPVDFKLVAAGNAARLAISTHTRTRHSWNRGGGWR